MPPVSACPTSDRLQQFALGLLPEPDSVAVENHLTGCEHCAHTVQSLPGDDTFVSALRSRASAVGLPAGAVVEGLMERLRGLRAAERGAEDTGAPDPLTPVPLGTHSALLGPALEPGEVGRLGGYRVLRMLDAGGMGVVFQAEDVALARPVAIKVMRPQLAQDPQARERFLREARAAAKVKSDHVVTIHQVGEDRGAPFLSMELLQGEPMDVWLRRGCRPNVPQILRLAREIAMGLAAAHERGLIHRDVKPGNVWLEAPTGRVKLLDFGLARPVSQDAHLTQSGTIMGTPAYMAPEQARGQKVDARADLFSLGCVLYQLCTGRLPFTGENAMDVLMALATETPRLVRELNPDIPERLSGLVARLLSKDPAGRPAGARDVVVELQAIERQRAAPARASALSVPVAAPIGPPEAGDNPWADLTEPQPAPAPALARPAPPRRRWPLAVAAGLLLALLGGAAAVYELTFKTPDGNLVVQIDDKDVETRFKDGELRLYDAAGQLKYTLKPGEKDKALAPGEYRIQVTGADGLKVDTNKFEMQKNGKVTVRVLLEAKAVAARKDTPAADPDRQVAEWVLKNGGTVCVSGQWVSGDAGTLPARPFRLDALVSPPVKPDDLLEKVRGLTNLGQLDVRGLPLGDADLDRLASVPAVENGAFNFGLGAGDRDQITDAGLAHLKRLRNLRQLRLECPKISPAGLAHLGGLKDLDTLYVATMPVTDAGLDHLKALTKLQRLDLRQTKVTVEGVKKLAAALPRCTIVSDHGTFGPGVS
jgi:hypothetical protein